MLMYSRSVPVVAFLSSAVVCIVAKWCKTGLRCVSKLGTISTRLPILILKLGWEHEYGRGGDNLTLKLQPEQ